MTTRENRWRSSGVRYAAIVLAGLLLGIVAGVALTLSSTKTYTSNATLFLTVPSRTAGELQDGSIFATARVQSYIELATSPEVLDDVIRTTRVSMSRSDLASEVTATAPPSKVLLMLSVQDPSAERARDLCRALSTRVIAAVNTLEADGSNKSPVKLALVRQPVLPGSPTSPRPALYIVVAALLGLVVGAVVALALSWSTRRRGAVTASANDTHV